LVLVFCAAALAWPAAAAPPPPVDQPPTWQSLTPSQQSALAPLRRDWPTLDSQRKLKWLEVAGRFRTMPQADRERVQARMAEWARMTPTERARARLQFQASRQFSPEDRQALWEAYQALPDDERRALAQRPPLAPQPASAAQTATSNADAKRNVLAPGRQAAAKPVTPTSVQAQPGVSTTLMSTKPAPPAHQQAGMPKIAASAGFVNPTTLLPTRGPQGAAVSAAPAPEAAGQP
jgi:hypothetical protein